MCRLQALASGHNDILAEAAEMLHEITHDGRGKEVCFAFSSLSLNQYISCTLLDLLERLGLDHRAAVSWVRHNRFRRNFRHLHLVRLIRHKGSVPFTTQAIALLVGHGT